MSLFFKTTGPLNPVAPLLALLRNLVVTLILRARPFLSYDLRLCLGAKPQEALWASSLSTTTNSYILELLIDELKGHEDEQSLSLLPIESYDLFRLWPSGVYHYLLLISPRVLFL
jgi:hypothetical protein